MNDQKKHLYFSPIKCHKSYRNDTAWYSYIIYITGVQIPFVAYLIDRMECIYPQILNLLKFKLTNVVQLTIVLK